MTPKQKTELMKIAAILACGIDIIEDDWTDYRNRAGDCDWTRLQRDLETTQQTRCRLAVRIMKVVDAK